MSIKKLKFYPFFESLKINNKDNQNNHQNKELIDETQENKEEQTESDNLGYIPTIEEVEKAKDKLEKLNEKKISGKISEKSIKNLHLELEFGTLKSYIKLIFSFQIPQPFTTILKNCVHFFMFK